MNYLKIIAGSAFLRVAGVGFGFLAHLFMARLLGAEEFGVFNFFFAIASILAMIGSFGFPNALTRFTQEYLAKSDTKPILKRLILFTQGFSVFLSIVIAGLVFAALYQIPKFSHLGLHNFIAAILLTLSWSVLKVNSGALRGLKKINLSVLYETVWRDGLLALCLAVAFFMNPQNGLAETWLYWSALLSFLGVLTSQYTIHKAVKTIDKPEEALIYPYKYWLLTSMPMMLVSGVRLLMMRTDLIILGVVMSTANVGIYAAAVKIAGLVAIAQMAVMPYFSPHAAEHYAKKEISSLRNLFVQMTKLQSLASLILIIGMFALAPFLLGWMGEEFKAGFAALMILAVSQWLGASCGPAANLLIMSGKERIVMWMILAAALINIPLTFAFIQFWGIEGAALATAIVFIGQSIAPLIYAKKTILLND